MILKTTKNATVQLHSNSERSQVVGQFHLHRFCNQGSKLYSRKLVI